MNDKNALTVLRGWAQDLKSSFENRLNEAYVFGSLVNDGGRAFSPARSDIDLILVTNEREAAGRVKLLTELHPHVTNLEELLRATMGRRSREPITSITLATRFELEQGIHKERNSRRFFATPGFLALTQFSNTPAEIGNQLAPDLLEENLFSIWTVMAAAQGRRNKFLRRTAHGKWALEGFRSDVFVLPKDMLRAAYAVECASTGTDESFCDIDDTAKGIDFIREELKARSADLPEASDLLGLMGSNRPGGKGRQKDVPAELLLYGWELLSTCAEGILAEHRQTPVRAENEYAAREVAAELLGNRSSHLRCVDTAVELYRGSDLVAGSSISVAVTHRYSRDLHEITQLDEHKLGLLASEWPDDIAQHLKARFGRVTCTRFRRHRVRCFAGAGGGSWRGGSLRESSSLRRCA